MFLVIGNAVIDLFIGGFSELPSIDGDEFTNTSLIFTEQPLRASVGGNGGNTAYVLASLGVPTALCSAIGDDDLGTMFVGWLESKGVALDALARYADEGTSTSTVITDQHHNRLTFHYGQPALRYTVGDIPPALFATADGLLISSYSLFTGLRGDGYRYLLQAVHERGGLTAVDIGPALLEPARTGELLPLLPYIDYLIANEYELSICTGTDDREQGITRLLGAGAKTVLVKRGKDGVCARGRDLTLDVPGFPVTASTTTVGAGDSFNAGFIHALRQGQPLQEALQFGNATAALVVASGRGVLGAPSIEDIERLVETASA